MIKHIHTVIPIIFLFFLSSCSSNAVYDETYTLIDEKWEADSLYKFNFEITDPDVSYNILFNIRNRGDYSYQNLLMYVYFVLPENQTIHDTVNCLLADNKGKWTGIGWGSMWERTVIYKNNIRFPAAGQYSITIEHAMREKQLKAITNIGLRVEKIE